MRAPGTRTERRLQTRWAENHSISVSPRSGAGKKSAAEFPREADECRTSAAAFKAAALHLRLKTPAGGQRYDSRFAAPGYFAAPKKRAMRRMPSSMRSIEWRRTGGDSRRAECLAGNDGDVLAFEQKLRHNHVVRISEL